MILLLVGVSLEVSVANGVPVIIKGEPRGAILAFLVATVWSFIHLEWMTELHAKVVVHDTDAKAEEPQERAVVNALRFKTKSNATKSCRSLATARLCMWSILALAIGLFLAGSLTELAQFSTFLSGETVGCVRSYNLYTMGTELVSAFFLQCNSAKPGTWTLYMAYILFCAVAPLFVSAVHVLVFVLNVKAKNLCRIASVVWTFASVEVMLLSLFVVQVRESVA